LITHLGVIALFSSFFFFILILFALYFKNYLEIDVKFCNLKLTFISYSFWNIRRKVFKFYKFDEKKGNNFEVNLITHLGVIALFSSFFFFILILFVLYFKNYLEIDVKFKLQKCAACQDLPTLQFWSKSVQSS
jgi:archaellum component FlaF (FlaF/FlaG flagellin family)